MAQRREFVQMCALGLAAMAPWAGAQGIGQTLTPPPLLAFDGRKVSPEDLRGRPVLVYFWASWCPHCFREMPLLNPLYSKYKEHGFEILAINVGEPLDKAKAFADKQRFLFPAGLLEDSRSGFPDVRATPSWFLLDRSGVVRARFLGKEELRWELEKALVPLL